MKRKDIAAGAALLAALANPGTMARAIADLDTKNEEVTAKLKELLSREQDMSVRGAALDALMEDHRRKEAYLTEWQQKLEGREKDHQASIEVSMADIIKQRNINSEVLAERTEQQNVRENSLNEQARKIMQERQVIDAYADRLKEREETIAAREEKWQHDHQELQITKAKLRELTA